MHTNVLRRNVCLALLVSALAVVPSFARAADLKWRGLLDLVGSELAPAFDDNTLTRGDNPYDPYRVRLFVESAVDEHVQVLGQFVLADATNLYVDGAYAIVTPWPGRDAHLLAGKLPWAVGTWGPRTYSNKNPLIGAPLLYQWHSSLLWYEAPPSADVLLAAAGTGQHGVDYFGYAEGVGMPVVDDSYWDFGVTVAGSERPLEYALGVVAGAPGWGSTMQDDNAGKCVLGRVGLVPLAGVRVGVSGSYGPYLGRALDPVMPAGTNVNDYAQKLVMADLELERGHVELRGEAARNVWESPAIGDLAVNTGYAEMRWQLPQGFFAAGRWDVMRFGDICDSTGARRAWDWNVTRVEAGVGYRITREAMAKLTWQRTSIDTGAATDRWRRHAMLGAQLSIAF